MEERIRAEVVAAARTVVPTYLSEAETDTFPYAVYDFAPEYLSTKDGVYKISADVPVVVYSKTYAEAAHAAEKIAAALMARLVPPSFRISLSSRADRCVEGIWQVEIRCKINQNQ